MIGLIAWITFLFMQRALGVSTAFVRLFGFLAGIVSTGYVTDSMYLSHYIAYRAVFEWQFAFVVGIFIGALISAKLTGITLSSIPYIWGERFGYNFKKRAAHAFVGGFLILFGARLAGGCTTGHGLSGALQLAVSSWMFLAFLFASGIIAAKIIYPAKNMGN